jgi:hypothetical protein
MTDDRLPLAELMAKTGDGDFLRTIAESVLQIIMEADVDGWSVLAAMNDPATGQPGAMATATAASIPGSARSTSRSPSCGLALTFRAFWNRGRPLRKRWSR